MIKLHATDSLYKGKAGDITHALFFEWLQSLKVFHASQFAPVQQSTPQPAQRA